MCVYNFFFPFRIKDMTLVVFQEVLVLTPTYVITKQSLNKYINTSFEIIYFSNDFCYMQ